MLEKLGEMQIPEKEIPAGLAAAADELIRLRVDLARFRNDRPEFAAIRAHASALIDRANSTRRGRRCGMGAKPLARYERNQPVGGWIPRG